MGRVIFCQLERCVGSYVVCGKWGVGVGVEMEG